jgi:release factor glutamine methyltransferase
VSVVSLEVFLKDFFQKEKRHLLDHYPGLTIPRLRQDLSLHAFLNGIESDDIFSGPYIPHRKNPLTLFFESLKKGIPLEYITGYSFFYRSLFKVTNDVLIPRSETEILVEMAEEEIKKNYAKKTCKVLDLGTGSGAIALSLMSLSGTELHITASDISSKALRIAKENAFNLKYSFSPINTIEFIESDKFEKINDQFNLILSNPPYIKANADKKGVHHQVIKFEPELALFLKDDEYTQWFTSFFESIFQKLLPEGVSLIEGHEDHLDELADISKKIGFSHVHVIMDYTQRKRFLKLKK